MRGVAVSVDAGRTVLATVAVAIGVLLAGAPSAMAVKDGVGIELNKLSSEENSCQAFFVFDNQGPSSYPKLKIDLVVFNSEDVFERRFAMNVAPLDAKKRTLRMFELKKVSCDDIGSFLINGVLECQRGKKARSDCVQLLEPSSRLDVELTK